ncbi:MAG: hypothetical protein HRU19_00600 [Pseudobacteriovorax sp.]|nr:hypothetical protein [Pseudobacteriovorax sp.]
MRFFPLFLICFAFLASCVSVDGEHVDSSFTYQALGKRGVKLTPVQISDTVTAKRVTGGQLLSLLGTEIRDERKDIKVHGKDDRLNSRAILKQIRSTNELSQEAINSLPGDVKPYVVYASIISDDTQSSNSENKNDKDQITGYVYSTERLMTVAFRVYDLKSKKMVWSGDVNKRLSKSKTYSPAEYERMQETKKDSETINMVGSIAKAISGKSDNKDIVKVRSFYPKAPSQRKVLKELFSDFADALPKKGMFE